MAGKSNKTKRQEIFSFRNEEERGSIAAWLTGHGFSGDISARPNTVSAVCADFGERKFFLINACCAGALAQAGRTFYHAEDLERVLGAAVG